MLRFEKSLVIYKPRHDVFKFVANPANMHIWRSDISSTKFLTVPIKAGDTFEEVDSKDSKISVVRVVDIVPDERIVLRVMSGGMYLPKRELIFDDEDGHTILNVTISALSDGFSRWMEPIAYQDYSLKWDNYLFALKRVLEVEVEEKSGAD